MKIRLKRAKESEVHDVVAGYRYVQRLHRAFLPNDKTRNATAPD
jgi:hypothetical protein